MGSWQEVIEPIPEYAARKLGARIFEASATPINTAAYRSMPQTVTHAGRGDPLRDAQH